MRNGAMSTVLIVAGPEAVVVSNPERSTSPFVWKQKRSSTERFFPEWSGVARVPARFQGYDPGCFFSFSFGDATLIKSGHRRSMQNQAPGARPSKILLLILEGPRGSTSDLVKRAQHLCRHLELEMGKEAETEPRLSSAPKASRKERKLEQCF